MVADSCRSAEIRASILIYARVGFPRRRIGEGEILRLCMKNWNLRGGRGGMR